MKMKDIYLAILDGGGTIWGSMSVLWEHYQAAFSYFGLLGPGKFTERFPFKETTEISSFVSFNSRKNIPKALLALYFSDVCPQDVLACSMKDHTGKDPETCLHDLVLRSWKRCPRWCFDHLAQEMGEFLKTALYNFDDTQYPPCRNVKNGLLRLQKSGYTLVMLSNRQLGSTRAILRNVGIDGMFDHVEAPLEPVEPTVKPVLKILERYGVAEDHRKEVVFIGDSNLDIASANEYGLFTIGVLTGMGSERVLPFARPAAVVQDIAEAARLLKKLRPEWGAVRSAHASRIAGQVPRHDTSTDEVGREQRTQKTYQPDKVYLLRTNGNEVSLGELVDHKVAEQNCDMQQACVYVALVNSSGKVYSQCRASTKHLNPNLKTISASGHVDPGETFQQAALRELEEELGIKLSHKDIHLVGSFKEGTHCGPVYECRSDQAPKPNSDELDIKRSRFYSVAEVRLLLKCNVLFSPSGSHALKTWLESVHLSGGHGAALSE